MNISNEFKYILIHIENEVRIENINEFLKLWLTTFNERAKKSHQNQTLNVPKPATLWNGEIGNLNSF